MSAMNRLDHVGVIPDGNRRWCDASGIKYDVGYRLSFDRSAILLEYLFESGIHEISLYLLSRENLHRKRFDLDAVISAIEYGVDVPWRNLCERQNVLIRHVGLSSNLPASLQDLLLLYPPIKSVSAQKQLNLLIDYNPIEEIHHSININPEHFEENFWVTNPVDLVIRTAGTSLLSNFLPLQCGYAILWTSGKFFPDLTTEDIRQALEYYRNIDKRSGK